MTTVAWRLFRSQAVWGAGAVAVVGVVLLATGPHLVHVYDDGLAACRNAGGAGPACINPVADTDHLVQVVLAAVVLIAPALVGIFWGAPLIAREFETGTFRLAWTQGVTRMRWLVVKLAVGGGASLVGGAALGLMTTWWSAPIDAVNLNRFTPGVYQVHGVVPGGYALFAFVLGATTGVLFRRVLPAMATTLVLYVVTRAVITFDVRPFLLPPVHLTEKVSHGNFGLSLSPSGVSVIPSAPGLPNAWVTSVSIVDKAGHTPTSAVIKQFCSGLPGLGAQPPAASGLGVGTRGGGVRVLPSGAVQQAMSRCIANFARSYHVVVTYQPGGRFWTFQALETVAFVVISVALAAVCGWWVVRRLT